jgi:3',5'-cyclic AMP phosphodiesterase CpdA
LNHSYFVLNLIYYLWQESNLQVIHKDSIFYHLLNMIDKFDVYCLDFVLLIFTLLIDDFHVLLPNYQSQFSFIKLLIQLTSNLELLSICFHFWTDLVKFDA